MLIRITQHTAGIEEYLETGKKQGRKESRDELDQRVCLDGDLQTLSWATQYTRRNKDWKNHYWHITASFALENNDLDNDTLKDISQKMLDYYYCAHNREKLIYAVEAHRPKIQSTIDKSSGEVIQRLLHMHLVVSKYDVETDNQIRMIPYKEVADREFQSALCRQYNLVDPQTRRRHTPKTQKDMIAIWKGDAKTSKQTKVAQVRTFFAELLNNAQSLDEVQKIILGTGLVKNIVSKQHKGGHSYFQVKMHDEGMRNVNLRGRGFEALEKLYSNNPVKASQSTNAWQQHKQWWLKEQKKTPKKCVDYKRVEKNYDAYFETYKSQQRQYFVIYKSHIDVELILDYLIYEKANENFFVNNNLNVKIFDQGDKIVLALPDDDNSRSKAVRLALTIARDKGWNLNTLDINGSDRFKKEVAEEIKNLQEEKVLRSSNRDSYVLPKAKPKPKRNLLNVVDDAIADLKENEKIRKLSAQEIKAIKIGLSAKQILQYAIKRYQLVGEHYAVTSDNKIMDKRLQKKPLNNIDFLVKTCNVRFSDTMLELHTLYKCISRSRAYEDNCSYP